MHSSADPTTQWAEDAVAGRIVVGELVRMQAQRHLRDLEDGPKRGLVWRPDVAQRALDFFPALLSVTAGAKEGQPFQPLPWMVFCTGSLFGWHWTNGLRRFREAWVETGKGQAKSPWMAAVGLYMMGFCGIQRSEVYAIASDKNQANVLFKDAVAMCRAPIPNYEDGATLESIEEVLIRGTGDLAYQIEHTASASKFKALASVDAISGPRPSAVLADEIHEMKTDKAIETWKAAITKMHGDPLMLMGTNTPAASQIVGTAYSERFQRIVRGQVQDDTAFAFIARVDEGDDPFEDESCWVKALPALGITYPIENIRNEVNAAKAMIGRAFSVKRLFFGIPVGTTDFWIDEGAWAAVQGDVDPAKMKGRRCWLSLDLSKKNDLTALSACWEGNDGHLFVKTWYWTCLSGRQNLLEQDRMLFEAAIAAGNITEVQAQTIEFAFVARQAQRLAAAHDVEYLTFDPAMMADFIDACDEVGLDTWEWDGPDTTAGVGLKLVRHGQGLRRPANLDGRQLNMPSSLQRFEDRVLDRTLTIDRNPITYACAANAAIATDDQGNRAFSKKQSRGRIDGLVTCAMVAGAATGDMSTTQSVYKTRGILMI